MSSLNPSNERLKHDYCGYLKHSEGLAELTIDLTVRSIAEYEQFTAHRDFQKFRAKDAIAYREHLLSHRQDNRGSLATVHSKLMRLEKFFRWIAFLPGRKKRISYAEIRCLGLSRKDRVKARQIGHKPTPTLEQVRSVISAMPAQTDVELRNRAVVATLLLTAVRITALTTLKLKHFDIDTQCLDQTDPQVDTKGGQPITTYLMPLDDGVQAILIDYVKHLRAKLGWTDEDPLFPATHQAVGSGHKFTTVGLKRDHWKNTDSARKICKRACRAAGLSEFTPHALPRTAIREGEKRCQTPEEFQAWAQNVGQKDPATSFRHYGMVPPQRQREIIASLGAPSRHSQSQNPDEFAASVAEALRKTHGIDLPCRGELS